MGLVRLLPREIKARGVVLDRIDCVREDGDTYTETSQGVVERDGGRGNACGTSHQTERGGGIISKQREYGIRSLRNI